MCLLSHFDELQGPDHGNDSVGSLDSIKSGAPVTSIAPSCVTRFQRNVEEKSGVNITLLPSFKMIKMLD